MPRKKKTEAIEEKQIQNAEQKVEKLETGAEGILETVEEGIKEAVKEIAEVVEENLEDKRKKRKSGKKKEVKMLSEKELKKVMTDTKETLVPLTDYIKCSVHLGTKVITPDMRKYVYKRRADGLAVINTNLIDDKLREASAFLNQYDSKDIFIACKREAGWPATKKFSEVTGIKCFTKKYPAGIITNLILDDFFEAKLVIICDPWIDKNALNDALKLGLPVIGICDTNNYAAGITKKIISNNKSNKSIGLMLYILAREYLKSKNKVKEAKELKMEDFTGKLEENIDIGTGGYANISERVAEGV